MIVLMSVVVVVVVVVVAVAVVVYCWHKSLEIPQSGDLVFFVFFFSPMQGLTGNIDCCYQTYRVVLVGQLYCTMLNGVHHHVIY